MIFAIARAGMIVFEPSPEKPPEMPLQSSVGRAHTRSSVVKPFSPCVAGEPVSGSRLAVVRQASGVRV